MADGDVVDLGTPRAIHLVGVGGAGISAIGIILAAMGHRVTGTSGNANVAFDTAQARGAAGGMTAISR